MNSQIEIAFSPRDVIHNPSDALLGRYIHDNRDDTSALRTELAWGTMDAGGCLQDLKAAAGYVDFASVGGQGLGEHYPPLIFSKSLSLYGDGTVGWRSKE